jgi:hypothetical protein
MILKSPDSTSASTMAQALWTLRGRQTPATTTDGDALGGLHGGLYASQRTEAHGVDGSTGSPKGVSSRSASKPDRSEPQVLIRVPNGCLSR